MPTTIHFTKTVKETRVYEITHDLSYDDFKEAYMTKMTDESDENFKKRCDEVWNGMCDGPWNKKVKDTMYIDLGEVEDEEEYDAGEDWNGDAEQEFETSITDIVDKETRQQHPHFVEWEQKEREKATAEWKAKEDARKAKEKEIADLYKRIAELTARV
jgi:tRNA nucleotidyltransferase/poly(A) polymerase